MLRDKGGTGAGQKPLPPLRLVYLPIRREGKAPDGWVGTADVPSVFQYVCMYVCMYICMYT